VTSVNDFANGTEFDSITLSSAGYTISGNDITLLNGVNASTATGANSFSLKVTLLSGQAWTAGGASTSLTLGGNINTNGFTLTIGGSGGASTLDGVISGAGGLTKAGSGTLVLAAANTYSGGTTVSAGTLTVGNASALGSGTLTLDSNTTMAASASGLSLRNAVTAAGNFTLGGTNALTLAGVVTLTGSRTITMGTGMSSTLAGGVLESPAGQRLTKAGSGTLVLPGRQVHGRNHAERRHAYHWRFGLAWVGRPDFDQRHLQRYRLGDHRERSGDPGRQRHPRRKHRCELCPRLELDR
jgi:autotransporter-associated beta strand protein